jgi:hypothetical protein
VVLMNYVVTEDKKSGFYIWNAIIKSASKNVSVVSAGGKDQLYYKVRVCQTYNGKYKGILYRLWGES